MPSFATDRFKNPFAPCSKATLSGNPQYLKFVGWTIDEVHSDFCNPLLFQLLPPPYSDSITITHVSSPYIFSVPTRKIDGFESGVQLWSSFFIVKNRTPCSTCISVFKLLWIAVTYQVFSLYGWITISDILPDITGPMLLNLSHCINLSYFLSIVVCSTNGKRVQKR